MKLRPSERLSYINEIAYHMQDTMVTSEINFYFGHYNLDFDRVKVPKSKRVYVQGILENATSDIILEVANDLGLVTSHEVIDDSYVLNNYFNEHGFENCKRDFDRCLENISNDIDTAIGNASSTLESIFKAILDDMDEKYPKDESMSQLAKSVFKKLNLSPSSHADPEIKRILGGLLNAGLGIGTLRTKFSSFHGKGEKQTRLEKRHARLVINSLTTIGLFVLETYLKKHKLP